jgi:hypothetical protein
MVDHRDPSKELRHEVYTCDTRFAKKRSWRLFFFCFFLIRVMRFGDLEFFGKHSPVRQ